MEDKKPEYKVTFSNFKPGICIYGIDHKANKLYYQKAVICPRVITGYVIPTALGLRGIKLNDKNTINQIKLGSAIDYLFLIGDLETEEMEMGRNLEGRLCEDMKNNGFYAVKVDNPGKIKAALKEHEALLHNPQMEYLRTKLQKQFFLFLDENPSLDIDFSQLQSRL